MLTGLRIPRDQERQAMDFASLSPYIGAALSFMAGAWVGPYIGGYSKTEG